MSSAELTEWMAYESVTGPLGPERMDALISMLTATVSNTARGKGKAVAPKDFMPKWDRGAKQDWREMLSAVKAYNRQIGGTET
jgi:hypothetical protein